jgi:hypothetical protein
LGNFVGSSETFCASVALTAIAKIAMDYNNERYSLTNEVKEINN